MKVLLSIKSEFVENILNGAKKVEFKINEIIKEKPDTIWNNTK